VSMSRGALSGFYLLIIVKYFEPSLLIGYKTGVGWVFDFLHTHWLWFLCEC